MRNWRREREDGYKYRDINYWQTFSKPVVSRESSSPWNFICLILARASDEAGYWMTKLWELPAEAEEDGEQGEEHDGGVRDVRQEHGQLRHMPLPVVNQHEEEYQADQRRDQH